MIVQIEGTSGSGKSYIVKSILPQYETKVLPTRWQEVRSRIEGYEVWNKEKTSCLYVVGPYHGVTGRAIGGGVDSMIHTNETWQRRIQQGGGFGERFSSPLDVISALIEEFSSRGHVLFEGLIASGLFGRYKTLEEKLKQPWLWAFLDTPLEVCLERVAHRRETRLCRDHQQRFLPVEIALLNPQNTITRWHRMRKVYAKCRVAGLDARWIDHTRATEEILAYLSWGNT